MRLEDVQNLPIEKRKRIFVMTLSVIGIIFISIWIYDAKNRISDINIQGDFNYDTEQFNSQIEKTKEKIYKAGEDFKEEISKEQELDLEKQKAEQEFNEFIIANTTSTQIETTSSYAKEEDN